MQSTHTISSHVSKAIETAPASSATSRNAAHSPEAQPHTGLLTRFAPAQMSRPARRAFALEFAATCCVMLAVATIDGGVIAVFAKQTFSGQVSSTFLNVMVGLLGATSEFANILSFVWSGIGQGRPKARFIAGLQAGMVFAIALLAIIPTQGSRGLWLLLALVLASRICWSGMVTIRPTIWRANYSPDVRGYVVGLLSAAQVFITAIIGMGLAFALDYEPDAYRKYLPAACVVGFFGVFLSSRVRVRRESRLLREETQESPGIMKPWHGPAVVFKVLRKDKRYAQFMLWMFILGFANLTVLPTLVISLKEEYGFGYLRSILITSSIPCLITLIAIPVWRRFLDRTHVVLFRSIHSWTFVFAGVAYTAGAAMHHHRDWALICYLLGAVLMGVGFGGGSLAWNLGHVDFARPSQTSQYMATHVTLNGIRGLIAPITVAFAYEGLKKSGLNAHLIVQSCSLGVSIVGAAGFVHLRRSMTKEFGQLQKSRAHAPAPLKT
jgi:MFS family permease